MYITRKATEFARRDGEWKLILLITRGVGRISAEIAVVSRAFRSSVEERKITRPRLDERTVFEEGNEAEIFAETDCLASNEPCYCLAGNRRAAVSLVGRISSACTRIKAVFVVASSFELAIFIGQGN